MSYRVLHVVRHWMPDDRLVRATVADDGVITFSYRYGHIHPALVRAMKANSDAVADADVLDVDPARAGGEPGAVVAWLERDFVLGTPFAQRLEVPAGRGLPSLIFRCRADMVDPALIREINEESLPYVLGAMVPVVPPAVDSLR